MSSFHYFPFKNSSNKTTSVIAFFYHLSFSSSKSYFLYLRRKFWTSVSILKIFFNNLKDMLVIISIKNLTCQRRKRNTSSQLSDTPAEPRKRERRNEKGESGKGKEKTERRRKGMVRQGKAKQRNSIYKVANKKTQWNTYMYLYTNTQEDIWIFIILVFQKTSENNNKKNPYTVLFQFSFPCGCLRVLH